MTQRAREGGAAMSMDGRYDAKSQGSGAVMSLVSDNPGLKSVFIGFIPYFINNVRAF